MNIYEADILLTINSEQCANQRTLSEKTGYSIGTVNKSINALKAEHYLDSTGNITDDGRQLLGEAQTKNAIILAAGFGMRMVPINKEVPKGLLEIHGESIIERTIKQLKEAGIEQIYIVVGYLKECYEYLIDKYDINLIVNDKYAYMNNLYSVFLAMKNIGNTYIIPCDVWCKNNPYKSTELYSWYMVTDVLSENSDVRVNRKRELIKTDTPGNTMVGISYIDNKDANYIKQKIQQYVKDKKYDDAFWEIVLYQNGKLVFPAKQVLSDDFIEINTYEQLREIDSNSNHLKTDALEIICEALDAKLEDIKDIVVLKKGMTNRSFLFSLYDKRYIMRIPGEGTDLLIDRKKEADVYQILKGKDICDNIAYINPMNGYKITEFMNNARVCDPEDENDLKMCMKKLKSFHREQLVVEHDFNIFEQIQFYESLWENEKSIYRDYEDTKANVYKLKKYIDNNVEMKVLTHIDAVPDNFLIVKDENGTDIRLIDWEYAGMQDPHVDIAMFCIYSLYSRAQVDKLIDIYFEYKCEERIRAKIYCYIAACGLLWSNWCEYKRNLGIDFGEYSIRQYRYAKEYYKVAREEMKCCE